MENEELFEFMGKIYSEMQQGFKSVNNRIDGLEVEVKKNSIKLEGIEKNVNIITEVQQSHIKQNENSHIEMVEMFNDKLDLTQNAVKNLNRVK